MNDFKPWKPRSKHRDWRGWIIACAAIVLLFAAMALAYDAESAMLPPRPIDTQAKTPPPAGRHETRLYCRHFLPPGEAARRSDCRRIGGYR